MAAKAKTMLKLKFPINPILSLIGPDSAIPEHDVIKGGGVSICWIFRDPVHGVKSSFKYINFLFSNKRFTKTIDYIVYRYLTTYRL